MALKTGSQNGGPARGDDTLQTMKNFALKLFMALFAMMLLLNPGKALAQASTGAGGNTSVDGGVGVQDFNDAASESTGLTSTLRSVAKYSLYVFYLLGVIFMGVAAIKFKNGDMEAMGKNLGGAVALFLVPKIIEVILAWAAQ